MSCISLLKYIFISSGFQEKIIKILKKKERDV